MRLAILGHPMPVRAILCALGAACLSTPVLGPRQAGGAPLGTALAEVPEAGAVPRSVAGSAGKDDASPGARPARRERASHEDVSGRPPIASRSGAAPAAGPAADAADTEARVALGPGGRDLRLAGDLTPGVAARVSAVLAAHPEVARIHLTSDGGLVEEAVALGALVAGRGLDTYVPDACASACTLVFVRGRTRSLAAGGALGFHAPYETGPRGGTVPVDPAPERAAYLAAGIAPDFAAQALAVSSDDIWIPDAARLRQAGVVTDIVGTDRFPDSTLDADPSL